MNITTGNPDTLAEMLGNTIRKHWWVDLLMANGDRFTGRFQEVRGNDMKLRVDDGCYWFSLEDVEGIHIH